MLLSEIVKSAVPDEQIVASIRSSLKKRYEQARKAGQDTSPAEYLYIDELITLFLQTRHASDSRLWDESLTNLLDKVKNFRNDIMHPTRSLAASGVIRTVADFPRWATEVSDRLRGITALSAKPVSDL